MKDNKKITTESIIEKWKRKYRAEMEVARRAKGVGFAMMKIMAPRNTIEMMKVTGKHTIWVIATAENMKEISKKLQPLTAVEIGEELKRIFLK